MQGLQPLSQVSRQASLSPKLTGEGDHCLVSLYLCHWQLRRIGFNFRPRGVLQSGAQEHFFKVWLSAEKPLSG